MTTTINIPEWAKEYEFEQEGQEETKQNSEFEALISESSAFNFEEGRVYKGNIINITDDYVTVDIGYKQEGIVLAREFKNYDGSLKVALGDTVQVYLEKLESHLGNLVLSKDKAEILQAWDRISEACDKGEPVQGTVVSKVKGGLSVDIGVKAFLPGSQIDIKPTKNLDKFLGKVMDFKVIKFNKKRGNIVLSRRAILQEERGKLRDETLNQITEGMIVKGIVKNITDYGAFIDLGGVDGLLHITDMSWGRVKHPSNIISVGDELNVKILKYDSSKERVSLGLKQVLPNPWDSAEEKYQSGNIVEGEVVSVKDYGIFVELDDGIEGLVHVSEVSWVNNKGPIKDYNVGDRIKAQVLEIDIENKRISLGLKQLESNPWDLIEANYPVGKAIEGSVKAIVDFGIFVDLGETVDALIHVSDISWAKKNINPNDLYKIGDKVKAVVLTVDKENSKFCLGIKQLEEDPWKRIEERIPVGSVIETEVVRVTDFGAFAEIETGIEGLVHISELSEDRVENASDVVKVGDKIKTRVISIDTKEKKIALSKKSAENADVQSYATHKEEASTSALAEKLKGFSVDN